MVKINFGKSGVFLNQGKKIPVIFSPGIANLLKIKLSFS
jgi:hypothetical protein